MLSRSINLILFLILPTFITLFNITTIEESSINLLDPNVMVVKFYCDSMSGGSSTITGEQLDNNSYSMTYTLRDGGLIHPYAQMTISGGDSRYFDLSKYDNINIKLKSSSSNRLMLTALGFLEGFTNPDDISTYIPLTYNFKTNRKSTEIILDTNSFYVPKWWYDENNIVDKSKTHYPLDLISHFNLINSEDKMLGIEDEVLLEKLTITKDNRVFNNKIIKHIIFYYILLIIALFISRKLYKSKNLKFIKYNPLEITKETNSIELIEDYLGSNYSNSQLNLTKVSKDLNIPIKNLSLYINKKYNISFPIYLNQIRIGEAKKQLLNTDLKIVDIANSVGFNSAGHFNRVFKNLEFCTPNEFRKKYKKKSVTC